MNSPTIEIREQDDHSQVPGDSSSRTFGLVFTVVFLIIGLWPMKHGLAIRSWSIILSILFLISAIFKPSVLGPLNLWWLKFGFFLHKVTSPIILAIIYFMVVTPLGVIMKLTGKNPLSLGFSKDTESYWIEHQTHQVSTRDSMKNQF